MDVAEVLPAMLRGHPLVTDVRLTGSRAAGTEHALSDWDFLVETGDFGQLRKGLPSLVRVLKPLAAQWDRYSDHACFMLMLVGPTKVDLIFSGVPQAWAPPWEVSAESLGAIDAHFWDWILWLAQKESGGSELGESFSDLQGFLLGPMGADSAPVSIDDAVATFLDLRGALETSFGIEVPRELQQEVEPALKRVRRRR